MAKQRWRCTTKPRGDRPAGCDHIFEVYGATKREAKDEAEGECQAAGCHTPGGEPHNCDCGYTSCRMLPN